MKSFLTSTMFLRNVRRLISRERFSRLKGMGRLSRRVRDFCSRSIARLVGKAETETRNFVAHDGR